LAEGDPAESLYFEAIVVEAHPLYPVFGGETRGFFSGAGRGDETLFLVKTIFFKTSGSLPEAMSPSGIDAPSVLGFSPRYFKAELPVRTLFPGMVFSVVFSGKTLEFNPPVVPEDS
jgi:hypothetical protein